MKYERTADFKRDWRQLSRSQQERFRRVVFEQFVPACERRSIDSALPWPRSLRVRTVVGAPGVWEMTWSFAGPDGRATFEWMVIEDEPRIRWRRIGFHAIFEEP